MQSRATNNASVGATVELYAEMLRAEAREHPDETPQSIQLSVCLGLLKRAFRTLPEDHMRHIGDRQLSAEDIVCAAVLYQHDRDLADKEDEAHQQLSTAGLHPAAISLGPRDKVAESKVNTDSSSVCAYSRYATPP